LSEFTPAQHFEHFAEFCEYELATGGPDPHARYIGVLAFPQGYKERVWRGGVYAAVYNAPCAEAVYRVWPYERVLDGPSEQRELQGWITQHWAGLPLRRERRAVRTPEKLTRCLESYVAWMEYQLPPLVAHMSAEPYDNYRMLWKAADKALYGFGRYALTKLLDFYERYCDIPISCPDIRPVGGWSPREALRLMYPARLKYAATDDGKDAVNEYNLVAHHTKNRLRLRGLDLDWFKLEVMLCEYKESVISHRQYPGRSIDSELKYLRVVEKYWGAVDGSDTYLPRSDIWDVRDHLHPRECLGEHNGWDGPRDILGHFLTQTGETWSDLLYAYKPGVLGDQERVVITTYARREGHRSDRIRNLAQQTLGKGADKQPILPA
jgi:hypothetical protein